MSAKGASIASLLVGSAALAIITGRRGSAAPPLQPTTPRAPAPSQLPPVDPNVPTAPSVPTEQPRPRSPAAEFKFTSLHRYELTVDVLPVDGVGLPTVAKQALATMRFDDPALKRYKTVKREVVSGAVTKVVEVTQVVFQANAITNQTLPLDRQVSIAGVGSVWLVSAKEVSP